MWNELMMMEAVLYIKAFSPLTSLFITTSKVCMCSHISLTHIKFNLFTNAKVCVCVCLFVYTFEVFHMKMREKKVVKFIHIESLHTFVAFESRSNGKCNQYYVEK